MKLVAMKLSPFAKQPIQIKLHVSLRRLKVDTDRGSVINREMTCSFMKIRGTLRMIIEIPRSENAERIRRFIAFFSFAPNICDAIVAKAWHIPSLMKVKVKKRDVPNVKTRR